MRPIPPWLKATISIIALAIVATEFLNLQALQAIANNLDYGFLGLMVLIYMASKVLSAYRWCLILRCGQPNVPFSKALSITLASNFLQTFLPGGSGELVRVAAVRRAGLELPISVASVVLDRTMGFLSLGVMLVVGIAWIGLDAWTPAVMWTSGILILLLALATVLLSPVVQGNVLDKVLHKLRPNGVAQRVASSVNTMVTLFKQHPATLIHTIALSFLMQLLRVAIFALGLAALSSQVDLAWLLVLVPCYIVLLSMPISVGGVGVKEALLLIFFANIGASSDVALALSLLLYGANFAASAPGFLCLYNITRTKTIPAVAGPVSVASVRT